MVAIKRAIENEYKKEVEHAKCDLRDLIIRHNCAPIMLRLAFHDAGNYNAKTKTGGANGSIRNPVESANPANNGIKVALDFCDKIKMKHPMVTFADLYQLAGVVAVEVTGGPKIDFVPGRMDSLVPDSVRLPNANGGPRHLRDIFHRMGLSDKDIVALSGAHTLGRAHKSRSGFDGPFTSDPYTFDNSYFRELLKGETKGLLKLPTDKALMEDHEFKKYVQRYAKCEETFFKDYAESHKKMSELGFTPKCKETFFKDYAESHKKISEFGFTPKYEKTFFEDYAESHRKMSELEFIPKCGYP